MRKLVRKMLGIMGISFDERFAGGWSNRAILRSLVMYLVSFLRGSWFKLWMGRSEGMVLVGKGARLIHAGYLKAGRNFIAEEYCEINSLSVNGIVLGNKVTIGSHALIRPTGKYGGDLGMGLRVGDNSNIGPFAYIGCSGMVTIGNNVMISPRVSIYAENHNFSRTDISMKEQGVTREDVVIEDDCWIAANSVILAGVHVGKGSIIAAGSVVTKDIPPYSIVAGSPARVIKNRI